MSSSTCEHVMKSGPRKGTICNKPKSNTTRSEVSVCFHHTPERLEHQSARQKKRLTDMTPEQKVEESRIVKHRLRIRKSRVNYIESNDNDCESCSSNTEESSSGSN